MLRAAIAGGGLSTLEPALAAAPREMRESSVGVEAQQEAEHETKQEAAAEAGGRAAVLEAREVVRVGA